eukprot:TRINITY_DN31049_c0_g1_i1.p1 TRINITY_DN31049_c0_g1~~TRINITY_DN31049_c0_g1_i1.p1  ORF type:complete len:105 (+),score=10.47 TRINITY_DN31049_c0_g1_i1:94-408(+)
MIRRPPRSTLSSSSAASDVYKRQVKDMASLRFTPGVTTTTSHGAAAQLAGIQSVLSSWSLIPRAYYERARVSTDLTRCCGSITQCRIGYGGLDLTSLGFMRSQQ